MLHSKHHFPTRDNILVLVPSKGLQPSDFLHPILSRLCTFNRTRRCSEILGVDYFLRQAFTVIVNFSSASSSLRSPDFSFELSHYPASRKVRGKRRQDMNMYRLVFEEKHFERSNHIERFPSAQVFTSVLG